LRTPNDVRPTAIFSDASSLGFVHLKRYTCTTEFLESALQNSILSVETSGERRLMKKASSPRVAYFSMEIALEPDIPTYSGGLGILAGDTLRSAADLGTPVVAITLCYRKGYFRQILDPAGNQFEQPQEWAPEQQLTEVGPRVSVEIEGRQALVRAWKYTITGIGGEIVPVFLLDTDLPEN